MPSAFADLLHLVDMSSRFTKKSLLNVPGRSVNTPCAACPALAFRTRRPPTRTVISGTVSGRFERGEGRHVGLRCGRNHAPRREGHHGSVPGTLRSLLDSRAATQHDQVGERDLLPAGLRAVEVLLD